MLEIQKNIPLPKATRPPGATRRKYPLDTMEIGDMVFVPGMEKNTLTTHVSAQGRALGRKFATRLCHMRQGPGGWEMCDPDDEDATLGVGIWRNA